MAEFRTSSGKQVVYEWVPDDAPGWATYSVAGKEWFQLYDSKGALLPKMIRYRINMNAVPDGFLDACDLGLEDGPFIRVEKRDA